MLVVVVALFLLVEFLPPPKWPARCVGWGIVELVSFVHSLVEFPLAVLFILLIIKHTFQLPVLDVSAEKTASLVVNTCIVLSYPINFFVYCGMSRKFRQTFAELFCSSPPSAQTGPQTVALDDVQGATSAATRLRSRFSRNSVTAV